MTSNSKRAHSKALEPGCLFRFFLPTFNYDTVSGGRGEVGIDSYRGEGDLLWSFLFSLFVRHYTRRLENPLCDLLISIEPPTASDSEIIESSGFRFMLSRIDPHAQLAGSRFGRGSR